MIGTKFEKPLQNDTIIVYEEHEAVNEKGETVTIKVPVEKQNDAPNTLSKYEACTKWANKNNARLKDNGDYYECVEIVVQEQSLDELKSAKLSELESAFLTWYEKDAVVTSSLGFVADSDSRAWMDVSGLVTSLQSKPEGTTEAFMDHENQPHLLTLDQMKTVQLEIVENGQSAYKQKWAYRESIQSATTKEALDAIEIKFVGEDYSK